MVAELRRQTQGMVVGLGADKTWGTVVAFGEQMGHGGQWWDLEGRLRGWWWDLGGRELAPGEQLRRLLQRRLRATGGAVPWGLGTWGCVWGGRALGIWDKGRDHCGQMHPTQAKQVVQRWEQKVVRQQGEELRAVGVAGGEAAWLVGSELPGSPHPES